VVLRDGLPSGRVELACRCGWTSWAVGGADAERLANQHERQTDPGEVPGHTIQIQRDPDFNAVQVVCSCGWNRLVERVYEAERLAALHRSKMGAS
jgi:hypothetical protein